MKRLESRQNKDITYNKDSNTLFIILFGIIGVVFLFYIFYNLYYFLKRKDDKETSPSPSKLLKILKMGESLEGVSWNVKINDDKLRGKAEPFKIVFDTQNTGHINANQKTLDFLFGGKKTFTYTYQGKGTDLYHLIINNERWQLSFTRINDVLQENPSFLNTDRPSGIVMLDTERAE